MKPIAYVDDSGSGGDSRYYVLGGFKALDSTWEAFARDWQGVLDATPAIRRFKMQEAEHPDKGPFRGLNWKQRLDKVNAFIDVIEKHELFGFTEALSHDGYQLHLKPLQAPTFDDPYFIAFGFALTAFSSHEQHYESAESVHFVFDEQTVQEKAKTFYLQMHDLKPYRGVIASITFATDDQHLPLQAADLLAWQRRRRLCKTTEGTRPEYTRLTANPTRYYQHVWDDGDFARQAKQIQEMHLALRRGDITPKQILDSRR